MDAIPNYINGSWQRAETAETQAVLNPASQDVLAIVPLSGAGEVDRAVQAAQAAFPAWRDTPPNERAQYLYKMKRVLEDNLEAIARQITLECGKTLDEARGEMQRAIENVEVACGAPSLLQGKISEDIARGIDETLLRQPVGVCAAVTPFNFPGMIPFWFLPYAIACGNTFILKSSERVPLTMRLVFELLEGIGLPPGVLNLVNGGKAAVEALLDHPGVRAISFVGSTAVAKQVYARAAAGGKRAQCQGGAKNPIVILPDADLDAATRIVADSAFGCAGQRCLAASLAIAVGREGQRFVEAIAAAASSRVTGSGLDAGVQMGPVITPQSKARVEALVSRGASEGGELLVDGRGATVRGYERGNFIRPTVLVDLPWESEVAQTEIFGPVLSVMRVDTVEDAIARINSGRYGNMACLFTTSGAAARQFRREVEAGNIGINIGVAAPVAFFPFSGWKDSFFGDLHAQSTDGIDFYTQKKVVIERWQSGWSRKF
jgi:malonate-semialdehyde dehydrogenase (acetylating)/methylmalonate-semialdehyde dehydrogenase